MRWIDRCLARLARIESVFGSDVYVDYSHVYVWQANQFGHLLIGVFATLLFGWTLGSYAAGWIAVGALYAGKEAIDAGIALRVQVGVFSLDKREVLSDGLVDFLFVLFGGALVFAADPRATSGLTIFPEFHPAPWVLAVVCGAVLAFFLVVRRPFLARKHAFDKSGLPQLVRLSTFPDAFGERAATVVPRLEGFARRGESAEIGQIVITGDRGSGRSSLAKSIGGDATAMRRKVRYISAGRLIEKRRAGSESVAASEQPHPVGDADLIIVDDLSGDLLGAFGEGRGAVSALIDPDDGGGLSLFELSPRTAEGAPIRDPRPAPQVVWVIDDREAAQQFAEKGLPARFENMKVEKIDLSGRLSTRREAQNQLS